jgi:hypothetical protein
MQRLVVIAAIIATMGTASAGTPAGCDMCTLDAQPFGGTAPFPLIDLGTGIPQFTRQPIASPLVFPGMMTITFPASGTSGVYAGGNSSPFGGFNDSTNFLQAEPGDSGVTISYALPQRQLNLVWGTVGNAPRWRDQIILVFNDGTIGTIVGDDVIAAGVPFNSNTTVEITTAQSFTTAIFTEGDTPAFEFVPSVPVVFFAGTPGKPNCVGQSISALVGQFGGLNAAAAIVGVADVQALQNAISTFCAR